MRVRVLDGYPSTPVAVELTSRALRERMLEKLSKQAETRVKDAAETSSPHLLSLYEWITGILYESRLFLCWDEVMRLKKVIAKQTTPPLDSIKTNDKTGLITIKSKEGGFLCTFTISVPFTYPAE